MPKKDPNDWKAYEQGDVVDAGIGGYAVGLFVQYGDYVLPTAPVDALYLALALAQVDIEDPQFKFAEIEMPCGQEVTYHQRSDVPLTNTPCPCGNPRHWLIRYIYVPEG